MCVLNYNGFLCGHPGNEPITPISPILCRRQNRVPHEPMCRPLKYNIKLLETAFCEVCNTCLTEANDHWSACKDDWRKRKFLSEPVIQKLNTDRVRALILVFTEGIKQGPSHTEHLRLVPTSKSMQVEAERLANLLVLCRQAWDTHIISFRKGGRIYESEFQQYEQKRKDIEDKYESQAEKLYSEMIRLVNDFSHIHISRMPELEDWDTYEEIEAAKFSDVYLY
ncbi:hypothetical protein F5B21DRAFT_214909 [Xylaria acuta]|nr:hypothetical protein F5B21DRAFT_214909 [Xylaria acuta]